MSLTVCIDVSGMSPLRSRLSSGVTPTSLEALLEEMGACILSQTRRRILEEQRSPEGTPWEPWSSAYTKNHKNRAQLLYDEGQLFKSLTYDVHGGTCEVGTNLPYASTHQFGNSPRGIPKRPFLGVSYENLSELSELCEDWLFRRFKNP